MSLELVRTVHRAPSERFEIGALAFAPSTQNQAAAAQAWNAEFPVVSIAGGADSPSAGD